MPSDDYTPVVRGGLKLKGSSSGVKKKKSKKQKDHSTSKTDALQSAISDNAQEKVKPKASSKDDTAAKGEKDTVGLDLRELEQKDHSGKTQTERAYEENRRKRLERRLEKEGPKTHKQRVEELNTYLSTLSEHHDMPRIGPG